ncbi:HNH endonuclease [Polaribacter sp. R2A056_3_33]|uniref:HNH endonuclease n=1 Tax=Polaribacter sp. R2A056_3_33 TaxID=2745563 RepID=UPI001C4F1710|nr:HNH endonuclease [Polaribacter sp. R2A056_3_33]QXP71268.1 HNH endonuclease [Polaribacter sp. R2A056_3_33]
MEEKKSKLRKQLLKLGWDHTNIDLGLRANCKCEYCDKYLFESVDNYKLWQVDHIIPKISGYKDVENFDNKAISCVQCNTAFKGKWNPADQIGYNKIRENYIEVIRKYIKEKRTKKEAELSEIKEIFKELEILIESTEIYTDKR